MQPTLSVYVTARMLYGVVVSSGPKGLRLDAIAVIPRSDTLPLDTLRTSLAAVEWSDLVLVLESDDAALASFPIERDQSEMLVREQVELEIVQQFLSTP
ncbi:MAG: hypothetical protein N2663_05375, partial [Chlorobi bacterium]|nr:hypothetical protein [Chlorobiota bacterium]